MRLALSYGQSVFIPRADVSLANRLVFVCHGNICRSAYADVLARKAGMRTASFGLSTTSGKTAHPPVDAAARELGVDLSHHRTTAIENFRPEPGDLLLAMEVRQLAKLRRIPAMRGLQMDLLGRFVGVPHLHDPYQLNEDYLRTCLHRIDRAVKTLVTAAPNARLSR